MKYLVETLGDYGLHDLFGMQEVAAHRPSVVKNSAFIEAQRGRKLKVIEELADEADDKTLADAAVDALDKAVAALPRPSKDEPKPAAAKPATAKK